MINTLEESLNGGYNGLYGEVVTSDTYKMRDVEDIVSINDPNYVHVKGHKRYFDFTPSVVFDLGANVGIFSRYARELFPNALIVSVEPDINNRRVFQDFTFNDGWMVLISKAIGKGKIWHGLGAKNGSGEVYISAGLGYPENELEVDSAMEATEVQTITLSELINEYVEEGEKFIVKMDIEGNEHTIFSDEKEMEALRKADYICAEIHRYAINKEIWQEVQDKTNEALKSLELTHNCITEGVHFYATKK